jgi:hypothetical protein
VGHNPAVATPSPLDNRAPTRLIERLWSQTRAGWRACRSGGSAALAPGCAGRSWSDKASEHLAEFSCAGARGNGRIGCGEGSQFLFIVSLRDAKTHEPLGSRAGPKITI